MPTRTFRNKPDNHTQVPPRLYSWRHDGLTNASTQEVFTWLHARLCSREPGESLERVGTLGGRDKPGGVRGNHAAKR